MTITAAEVADGGTSNDGTLSLTFTASESTTDFVAGDVTVANATLGTFSGSGTTYTATLTPNSAGAVTVDVAGGTFTDAAGNGNTAAAQFNWTYDPDKPTMTITTAEVADGDTSNDGTLSLTFTASESTTDFVAGDVTVANATLGAFSGSGTTYTATLTPSSAGAVTVDVAGDTFTDAAGNGNTAAAQFNWIYDPDKPTMTITAAEVADGDTSNDGTLSLTFTASESTTDFVVGDVTAANATLGAFSGSGTTYTATLTPSSAGAVTVDVAGDTFTDAAGNGNVAVQQFNWVFDADGDGVGTGDPFPNADTEIGSGSVLLTTTPSSASSGCSLDESVFQVSGSFPSTPPANLLVEINTTVTFGMTGCAVNESMTVNLDFGQSIPSGSRVYKVTGEGWQEITNASINGSVITYVITDNGPLDENPADGVILDPVAVGAPQTAVAVPTLNWYLLAWLATMVAGLACRFGRFSKSTPDERSL